MPVVPSLTYDNDRTASPEPVRKHRKYLSLELSVVLTEGQNRFLGNIHVFEFETDNDGPQSRELRFDEQGYEWFEIDGIQFHGSRRIINVHIDTHVDPFQGISRAEFIENRQKFLHHELLLVIPIKETVEDLEVIDGQCT
jgi:hypothetical protein